MALFGVFSLVKLPVQLLPDIERPQLGISTAWRAASPQEIESEILEAQEEVLQGLPGLEEMVAEINQGWCNVALTFGLETDMQETLIDVISRLNRCRPCQPTPTRRWSGSAAAVAAATAAPN